MFQLVEVQYLKTNIFFLLHHKVVWDGLVNPLYQLYTNFFNINKSH